MSSFGGMPLAMANFASRRPHTYSSPSPEHLKNCMKKVAYLLARRATALITRYYERESAGLVSRSTCPSNARVTSLLRFGIRMIRTFDLTISITSPCPRLRHLSRESKSGRLLSDRNNRPHQRERRAGACRGDCRRDGRVSLIFVHARRSAE